MARQWGEAVEAARQAQPVGSDCCLGTARGAAGGAPLALLPPGPLPKCSPTLHWGWGQASSWVTGREGLGLP